MSYNARGDLEDVSYASRNVYQDAKDVETKTFNVLRDS